MTFINTTETDSHHQDLEKMSALQLLQAINQEDQKVAQAVAQSLPAVAQFIEAVVPRMEQGGRLFYLGAGTSGRLGIVDASECPPTFGVPHDWVIGIIAGGDQAIRYPVEGAEDDMEQGWKDMETFSPDPLDTVVGIAASGRTPYVIGALRRAAAEGLLTACITCNAGSPVTLECAHPLVAVVGPEVVTGSTRMKSGTAQKLLLNMISTGVMVGLGRVQGNKMVDMQLSNAKLIQRGTRMVMQQTQLHEEEARKLLLEKGSVRKAVNFHFENHA